MDRKLMPAREDAQGAQENDEVCDLDIILSRRATFTFLGKVREILPITTDRLFAFWNATQEFQKAKHESAEESNRAFFEILKTVCDEITPKEAAKMTVVQKTNLLEHITRKITGQKPVIDLVKKKVMLPESA